MRRFFCYFLGIKLCLDMKEVFSWRVDFVVIFYDVFLRLIYWVVFKVEEVFVWMLFLEKVFVLFTVISWIG